MLGTSTLCTVDEERDLNKQCAANAVLGMIKRTFLCKRKELILQLYKH